MERKGSLKSSNYGEDSYLLQDHFSIVHGFFDRKVVVMHPSYGGLRVLVFKKKMYESVKDWFKNVEGKVTLVHFNGFDADLVAMRILKGD